MARGAGEERKGMLSRGAAYRGGPSPVWGPAELAGDKPGEAGRTPVARDHKGYAKGLEATRKV